MSAGGRSGEDLGHRRTDSSAAVALTEELEEHRRRQDRGGGVDLPVPTASWADP